MHARHYARLPLVWPALGLLLGVYLPGLGHIGVWVSFVAVGLLALWVGQRWPFLALFAIGLLGAAGGGVLQHRLARRTVPTAEALPPARLQLAISVTQDARPTPFGAYCLGRLARAATQDTSYGSFVGMRVVIYLPLAGLAPRQGETLSVNGWLAPLASIRSEGYRAYLQRTGIQAVCRVRGDYTCAPASGLLALRARLSRRIAAAHPDTTAEGLLQALLLGDRGAIQPTTRQAFVSAGTAHLLAISGQHVALWVVLLSYLLGVGARTGFSGRIRGTRALVLVALLWVYAVLAGGSPSVLRAAAVVSMAALATTLQRGASPLNFVALSAIVQVVAHPPRAYDLSFQLSHAAAVGILLALPHLRRILASKPSWLQGLLGLVGVSLAAQVATLPFQWAVFGQLPAYGLLANLVAVPLSGALLAVGWAWLALGWVPGVGWLLAEATSLCAGLLTRLAALVAGLPGAVVPLPPVSMLWPALLGVGLLLLGLWAYFRRPAPADGYLLA